MQINYSIQSIFRRFKTKIGITFFLLILENAFKIIQPLILGIAINDLINNKNDGVWLFCLLYSLGFIVSVIRRYYDTRAYTFIYTKVVSEVTEIQQEKGISISVISARSSLIKELIDFFEHDIAQAFTSVISVVGSLIMLLYFDTSIFIASIISVVLLYLIYFLSYSKIYKFNVGLNDALENRVDVLESKDSKGIHNHFNGIAKWLIKLSDLDTLNFGIIEIILFILTIFSLYVSASAIDATAGSIFSVITYVLEFSTGVYMLPIVFQQVIRLKEISERLKFI
jgi:ABC-type multidrug transport system fused ATPase/permease subunit